MALTMTSRPALPEVSGVEHQYLDLPDGRMHIAIAGHGQPVLLLSGFGQSWWEWREVMPALAANDYQAIAPDLRGEGWSELPTKSMNRTRRAEDILFLLDRLGLDPVRLVSHDLGAISAYHLTLDHPERFCAQILFSVPPPQMRFTADLLPGMRHLWHQEVLAIPGLGPALLRGNYLPRWLFSHFAAQPLAPEAVEFYVSLLRDSEFSRGSTPLCQRIVLPELARITRGAYRQQRFAMPTLFVFGTIDVGFPPHVVDKLFADPSTLGRDVRVAAAPNAGHYVVDEAPNGTIKLIMDFFGEQAP